MTAEADAIQALEAMALLIDLNEVVDDYICGDGVHVLRHESEQRYFRPWRKDGSPPDFLFDPITDEDANRSFEGLTKALPECADNRQLAVIWRYLSEFRRGTFDLGALDGLGALATRNLFSRPPRELQAYLRDARDTYRREIEAHLLSGGPLAHSALEYERDRNHIDHDVLKGEVFFLLGYGAPGDPVHVRGAHVLQYWQVLRESSGDPSGHGREDLHAMELPEAIERLCIGVCELFSSKLEELRLEPTEKARPLVDRIMSNESSYIQRLLIFGETLHALPGPERSQWVRALEGVLATLDELRQDLRELSYQPEDLLGFESKFHYTGEGLNVPE